MTVHHLREALLFLALAGILVPVLQRLRVNQTVGFLLVGILFGPHGFASWLPAVPALAWASFQDVAVIKPVAELGIVFLMFMIGLELSPGRLWALRRDVFGTGLAQVAVSGIVLGLFAFAFGNSGAAAAAIGITLAMSSTAVVMDLMSRQHTLRTTLGQKCFAILMLQDLAVVPALILVEGLGQGGGQALWLTLVLAVLQAAATIGVLYFLGKRVTRPLFASPAVQRQPEVFVALILLLTLGIAALTAWSGLSLALGALLAGLLLADSEFQYEVEIIVEPFKGLLLGLFFMSVGMEIDLRVAAEYPLLLPASVLALLALKGSVVALLLRGLGWRRAVHGGLLLGQGGEFAFIILAYAVSTQVLTREASQFLLLVVGLSMLLAPMAAAAGSMLVRRGEPIDDHAPTLASGALGHLSGHVIIGGYGRVGQLVADVLKKQGYAYVAVERDRHLVEVARRARHEECVFTGDASLPEMLQRLGITRAACVVLTMDDPRAALHAVGVLRRHYPELYLLARARDERHARALKSAGASEVVSEAVESGLQMASFALTAAGMPLGAADFQVDRQREELRAKIDASR
ncbi:potassium transporter [Pseudoduganella sp. DS3]|uniref:Potassium transporter n=1 Tax=Pseudoduganella guangdongensis TaxID=2692179 RepID=A0A6N9HK82_9BURK|nr:cation:proton antiporter [Pseudoduganella guangdongensis]MYN04048.1 potassium transporter [Pseudoduganella guangdongensis]